MALVIKFLKSCSEFDGYFILDFIALQLLDHFVLLKVVHSQLLHLMLVLDHFLNLLVGSAHAFRSSMFTSFVGLGFHSCKLIKVKDLDRVGSVTVLA